MVKKVIIRHFISFVRIENCLFTAGISASGYILFNHPDLELLLVFLAVFLGTGASYAYNRLGDRKEDMVNGGRLNPFVLREKTGKMIVTALYVLGFLPCLLLSGTSSALYLILIAMGLAYSGRPRIKERFLLKNLYTGFGLSLPFVIGAAAGGVLASLAFSYASVVFIFGFTINVLGDMRGMRGDESIMMVTLPILLGFGKARIIAITGLLSILGAIVLLSNPGFYLLFPFILASVFFLLANRLRPVRISMLSSFALLPGLLLILEVIGGV